MLKIAIAAKGLGWRTQECNFRGPIPSSLAIAAALAAGDLPLLSR